jgi:hypothetical protein
MLLNRPAGCGMWIWNLPNCEGGSIDAIIAVCRRCNVHWVVIKAFDGEWGWWRQFGPEIVKRFQDAGIACGFWWYSVSDWQGQAQDAGGDAHNCTMAIELDNVERAVQMGPDFGIIDPEKEWCYVPGRRDDPAGHADAYGAEMRRRIGGYPVYAGIVPSDSGYWVGNPLAQIAAHFDGTCPQVYTWSWGADTGVWTDKAIRLSYGKPCYPIYESSSGNPRGNMAAQVEVAVARGCAGVSWWSWEHASDDEWLGIQAAGARLAPFVAATAAGTGGDAPRLALPFNTSDNPRAWHCQTGGVDYWVTEDAMLKEYLGRPDALQLYGLPVSGMVADPHTGLLVQTFERARLEVDPQTGALSRGRVGAELLAAAGATMRPVGSPGQVEGQ